MTGSIEKPVMIHDVSESGDFFERMAFVWLKRSIAQSIVSSKRNQMLSTYLQSNTKLSKSQVSGNVFRISMVFACTVSSSKDSEVDSSELSSYSYDLDLPLLLYPSLFALYEVLPFGPPFGL